MNEQFFLINKRHRLLRKTLGLLVTIFCGFLQANGQQLELWSGSASTTTTGPTTGAATQTATLFQNVGTSTTFNTFVPTTTFTVAFANQQYTTQASPGLSMGVAAIANNTSTWGPAPLFAPFNTIGSPLSSYFTSGNNSAAGTNFDVVNNYGYRINTDAFYQLGQPLNARPYYGDIVVTFSRPIVNPVLQLSGFGGAFNNTSLGTEGFFTELELSTADVTAGRTLTRLSGSTHFVLDGTNTKILNDNTGKINTQAGITNYASDQLYASGGSVRVNTTAAGITSVTFRVYLRGDGGSPVGNNTPVWGETNSSVGRSGDTWFISPTISLYTIAGTVFNDANGLRDNIVNGTGTNAGGLNAILYDNTTGKVAAIAAVAADGTYTTSVLDADNYTVYTTTNTATIGQTAIPVIALPTGYVSTGENNGAGIGNDGTINSILPLGVVTANVTAANFGIERPPTANAVTGTSQQNPGGNAKVVVPTLNGNDPEQGTLTGVSLTDTIIINTLPSNGTLYYNNVAVVAGDTIKNYNPALLMVDPGTGIANLSFTYSEVDAALRSSAPATVTMLFSTATAFACGSLAYQVAAGTTGNSTLYSYNVNTGVRTSIGLLPYVVNSLGYNTTDNFMWATINNTNQLLRIDATGATQVFTIPNLPSSATAFYNAGDVLAGGYMFFYLAGATTYYVVDINPAHTSYLQLVDPANSFAVQTGPTFGKTIGAALSVTDFAYNMTNGLLYGIENLTLVNGTANPDKFKLVTLNPLTGAVTVSATAVTGSTIQAETTGYGAAFFDATGNFYTFANAQGSFYKINITTNTATLLSTVTPSNSNDGASCPTAILSYAISGTVFNDVNGLADLTVNGVGVNPGGLNAILYDVTTGAVAAIAAVGADGTYSFGATPGDNFSVYISTATPAVGSTAVPTVTLPTNWVSTGENIGTVAGNDGTINGILQLGVVNAAVPNVNFGIDQRPTTGSGAQTASNPGGTNNLIIAPTAFTSTTASSDPAPGAVTAIIITGIPTGATTITVNGTTYGPGFTTFPVAGITVPTNASGQPSQIISVDPTINGATSVTIPFKAVDAAGVVSTNSGTAVITITDLVLSGSIYNDPNGVTNSLIDGTKTQTAGTQLYVNLVDPTTGLVVGDTAVTAAGTYSLGNANGLQANKTYKVVVSTIKGIVGTTTGATSTLPAPWVNTAEGSGVGDGTVDGILSVAVGTTSITTGADFGVESRPIVGSGTATVVNSGGTVQTTVPVTAFTSTTASSDATLVTGIRITAFPTGATSIVINGISYTSKTFPAAGIVVPTGSNGQPTQTITVDPIAAGATTVSIPFVAVDAAGKESATIGNAVLSFTAVTISGNVYNDLNGLKGDNFVNGTAVNGTDIDAATTGNQAVYVSLVQGTTILATVPVSSAGTYTFPDVAAGSYNIVLNTSATGSTTAALPTDGKGWVNTGEFLGAPTTAGNDGTVNGILPVTVAGTSLTNANFGIEQPPTAGGGTTNGGTAPTGTTQYTVPVTTFYSLANNTDLTVASASTPTVSAIRITAFPTGATSIVINGTSYTSATFPAAGVTVPVTPGTGAPTQTITVDPSGTSGTASSVVIPFKAVDVAGIESTNTGTAVVDFSNAITISGNVFNDVNGLNGGSPNTVDGTPVNGTDIDPVTTGNQAIYASLVNAGVVLQTVPISSTGSYSFTGVTSGLPYSVVLTTNLLGSATASLPTAGNGWVNTGENVGLGAGSDGTPNGIIVLGSPTADVSNANFGIEQPPTVGSGVITAVNPGGSAQLTVPTTAFTNTSVSSDPTPGAVTAILITALPTGASSIVINGTTYGAGFTAFPAAGVVVPTDLNGNPTQTITINPTATAGATTVTILFKAVDAAGVTSTLTGSAVINLTGSSITGTIFDDADGITDNQVDGTPVNGLDIDPITAGAQALYASLVQSNVVVAVVPVSATGVYTFTNVSAGNYTVVLNTAPPPTGSLIPSLPTAGNGWANTGENIGTGLGSDGTVDGILAVTVVTGANVTDADLGIDQLPSSGSGTQTAVNPGNAVNVTVNPSAFTSGTASADLDGNVTGIRISAIPSGAASITINGITYGTGFTAFPAAGIDVPTDANGNPTQTITVDPIAAGATTVTISFKAIDNAGKVSATAGSAAITFTAVSISGTIYNDTNGLVDGLVNGTAVNGTDIDAATTGNQAIYVSLVQGSTILATVPVTSAGTYSFPNVAAGDYTVVLHTNAAGSLIASLPIVGSGWFNTGENIGTPTTTGDDGSPDGTLAVTVAGASVTNTNFGIEQPPTTGSGTNTLANQNGTTQITVPANTFTSTTASSDPSPGAITNIRITAFPSGVTSLVIGGTAYISSTFPAGGITIPTDASGNPTQTITVDPIAIGATTVTIPFVASDAAGKESSNTGTATLNFTGVSISGNVYNDVNGLSDNMVFGVGTNAGGLNAVLIDVVTGNVVATTPVNADGTFSFPSQNGANYNIEITTNTAVVGVLPPAIILPTGWVSTGEVLGTGTGSDGTPNGLLPLGTQASGVAIANFGIDQLPTAGSGSAATANPGGTSQMAVPSSAFTSTAPSSDPSPGVVTAIRITAIPTGVTTIVINGTSYTSLNFPIGGVTVPTNANGAPTQSITVDPIANGATTVTIPFVAVDAAGKESLNAGSAILNISDLTIAGTVYDDPNGGTIDGTATNKIGNNTLYANLVSSATGKVLASVPVAANGMYSFGAANGVLASTSYTVSITNTAGVIGNNPPPTNLINAVNTAESVAAVDDGTPNGSTLVNAALLSIPNVNFGIDQLPTSTDSTKSQGVTNGLTQVAVPTLTGSDPEDNAYNGSSGTNTIIINTLPTNGTLFYNNIEVLAGQKIVGYNPALLTVQPNAGQVTVVFTFSEVDAAGQASATPGTVTLNFLISLPVTLVDFTGTVGNGFDLLLWNTATEVNSSSFTVQYGTDPSSFTDLGSVKAKGTGANSYSFKHNINLNGKAYYRLKMVDIDGTFTYSNIVLLSNNVIAKPSTITPNPAWSSTRLIVGDEKLIGTEAKLFDNAGRLLQIINIGSNLQNINIVNYAGGMYYLKLANGEILKLAKQ